MKTKVLITVKTYPLPSRSYDELVCTAGILEDGTWIRIYPVPFKFLAQSDISKYCWIEVELLKRTDDFRPESYSPVHKDFSDLVLGKCLGTQDAWAARKLFCLSNVYTNLEKLIDDSKEPQNKSLATFKPTKIHRFIVEDDERDWKPEWKEQIKQLDFFATEEEQGKPRKMIDKVPFKFYYEFSDDTGKKSRLMIEDWEIGALYWNCLRNADGNEQIAIEKVRTQYETQFQEKDIYLFLGTTKQWHQRRARNPFVIIGVFYPPKITQLSMDL